ncbi:hypothetical protein [Chitinophaga niabensis]|uniref:Uncharacterized protein n=1 Tax=Chitinophaga niabensis TaxID=536979 RepID=A0A1N6FJW2_9BACT|nr:hypothetical protein [Chitinophaga niabensis]SIN95545.1 hypothetical protein SAMN04488055_2260 [Chitinophaga niabensis]
MKTVTIKRTRGDVPLMLLIACVALFPGLYIMSENSPADIAFILAALFTLLVIVIAVFGFRVIFKYHSALTLTTEGVAFQDNNKKNTAAAFFYKWADIKSYQLITEKDRYYSNETGTYQENDVHSISLTLEDGSSMLVSADKFSKKPREIIELFDLYKKGDH